MLISIKCLFTEVKDSMTKIFVIAGEASGDMLGAEFLKDLKSQRPDVQIYGIGGPLMEEQGLTSFFPMEELSLMGIMEILPHIPHLLKRIKQTTEEIKRIQPDMLVTIDAPDFSFRVAKKIKKSCPDIKRVHYVAPTVWAWRAGRAKKVAKLYDAMLCLFPFEPSYFEKEGMQSYFVGHPVMQASFLKGRKEKFYAEHGLSAETELLGVFYGSRRSEVARTGDVLTATAKKWLAEKEGRRIVVPTLKHMVPLLPEEEGWIVLEGQKDDAMIAMDKAIAVSGTIGLELAVASVPHIIGYKANALTIWLIKKLVKTRYAHLANILLNKLVVPEFIQEDCTPENMYGALINLDTEAQKKAFHELKDLLMSETSAADAALSLLS